MDDAVRASPMQSVPHLVCMTSWSR